MNQTPAEYIAANQFKTRNESIKLEDVDDSKGIVVRYGSSFDTLDAYNERTIKGCFTKTIQLWGPKGKNRIKSLWQHNPTMLAAKTIELVEDDFGLKVTDQFVDTQLSKDILTLIKEEIITESSIGFTPKAIEFRDDGTIDLTEIQLYENSYVTWGANEVTPIVEVRSLDLLQQVSKSDDVFSQMKKLESMLRKEEFHTDEVPIMMELALAMWQAKLSSIKQNNVLSNSEDAETSQNSSEDAPATDEADNSTPSAGSQDQEAAEDAKEALNLLLSDMNLFKVRQQASDFLKTIGE